MLTLMSVEMLAHAPLIRHQYEVATAEIATAKPQAPRLPPRRVLSGWQVVRRVRHGNVLVYVCHSITLS